MEISFTKKGVNLMIKSKDLKYGEMEDENQTEETVGLDLENKDRTITITGLSLEDAAKIILQEQSTPGHYQILTQDIPDIPVSGGQACVTVVQEVTGDQMGVYEGHLDQTGEQMYITQEMLENNTIQLSDGSMYLAQDINQQPDDSSTYNTVYITPGELESAQKQTCQSTEESSEAVVEENTITGETENRDMTVQNDVEPKEDGDNCKTLHVNVIKIDDLKGQSSTSLQNEVQNQNCDNQSSEMTENQNGLPDDDTTQASTQEDQDDNSNEGREDQEPPQTYIAEADKSEPTNEEVKTIDLSKPIAVTDSTEIIIKGKKCVLMPNPETGQLCAYPVVPPTSQGKKKRGRPKKTERKDQDYVPPAQLEEGSKPVGTADNKNAQANAVEGLLELSNTGPDGIRRSSRAKKKKSLEDYELLEGSSDEDNSHQNGSTTGDEKDYVPPSYALYSANSGIKRGRGRPRRYPPPGQTSTSSIPAVIIPGVNGQTLMMAPIQGLQNFQAFQEQIKSLPDLINKSSDGVTTINAQIINTSNGQIISTSAGQIITNSEGQIISTGDGQIISAGDGQVLSTGEGQIIFGDGQIATLNNEQSTMNENLLANAVPAIEDSGQTVTDTVNTANNIETESGVISNEGEQTMDVGEDNDENDNNGEDEDLEDVTTSAQAMVSSIMNQENGSEGLKAGIETTSDGQTILQIPEDLLPMFVPKKDPIKLGLKASERELEKLKCPKCDFQAFYLQQYQSHIAIHSDDVQKCKCCNFNSFDRDSLLQHFKETHPRCICNICDFMAEHAYVIKRHMMRHSGEGCTCDLCGKTYKDQYILKMHVKMVHMPAEVLFECTICFKKFTRKAHLKRHLRIHEAEKPFKCPHCEYRGCERSDISKHLLIHEEPKHICKVCGKAFRHIKNKELHLKRHKGQKDYKCGVCEYYGYTFTDIRKHIERRHADIRTLVCDKCGSAFKSEALLHEHQKQQCEVFMIEQGYSIATSNGGTSQAMIQIPSTLSVEGQQITIDGQQITVEQVIPDEDISLTEEELQDSLQNGSISEAQVIEACQVEMNGEEDNMMQIETDMDTEDGLSMAMT